MQKEAGVYKYPGEENMQGTTQKSNLVNINTATVAELLFYVFVAQTLISFKYPFRHDQQSFLFKRVIFHILFISNDSIIV